MYNCKILSLAKCLKQETNSPYARENLSVA